MGKIRCAFAIGSAVLLLAGCQGRDDQPSAGDGQSVEPPASSTGSEALDRDATPAVTVDPDATPLSPGGTSESEGQTQGGNTGEASQTAAVSSSTTGTTGAASDSSATTGSQAAATPTAAPTSTPAPISTAVLDSFREPMNTLSQPGRLSAEQIAALQAQLQQIPQQLSEKYPQGGSTLATARQGIEEAVTKLQQLGSSATDEEYQRQIEQVKSHLRTAEELLLGAAGE